MREFWKRERRDGTLGRFWWTNLFGERVSTGCTDLRAATAWKRAREREGADPRVAAAAKASLEGAILDFYAELRRRDRSAAYQKKARQKLGHFPRLWGAKRKLGTIDARLIGEYIDVRLTEPGAAKGSKVARITIRDELGFLGQMLALARRNGEYPYAIDDVMPLQWETGHKPRKRWISERDFCRLLRHVEPRHAAHLAWLAGTGSRMGESYKARREDAGLSTWRVLVRGGKTPASWAHVAIPSSARRWVRYALKHAEGEDFLFRDWPNMARDMKAACVRAGVLEVTAHDLRRSFGKWLRLRGYDLDVISKLLRHTTDKLAREVYADVDGAELSHVVERARQAASRTYKTGTRLAEQGDKRR